mmetsp:Transcript_41539/g.84929  ORF Transcript_41539/g.84929 Transcript_41539/m.84929 type:complete len:161 (-) Transcript_41539:177-659(-)
MLSLNVRPVELWLARICGLLIILGLRPVKTTSCHLPSQVCDFGSECMHKNRGVGVLPLLPVERTFEDGATLGLMGLDSAGKQGKPRHDPIYDGLGRIQRIMKNLRKHHKVPDLPPASPSVRLSFLKLSQTNAAHIHSNPLEHNPLEHHSLPGHVGRTRGA